MIFRFAIAIRRTAATRSVICLTLIPSGKTIRSVGSRAPAVAAIPAAAANAAMRAAARRTGVTVAAKLQA